MIKAAQLTRHFDKRGIAGLRGVSFNLKKGEVLSIIGPNGSGKSTLLNICAGKILQESGELKLSGGITFFPSVTEIPKKNVQKWLIESVTLDIDEEKKIQLTRDLADTFEFTFQLRQNLSELSSGQKQKVLLARELINKPALLLMDEPFAHLDPFSRSDILNNLFSFIRQQEISVLWVTHDLNEAFRFSNTVGILNFGKLEQLTSPLDLVKNPRNLFVAQYIGYRNFLPTKGSRGEDALMVVPDSAWKITDDGETYVIQDCIPFIQTIQYQLRFSDRILFWQRPATFDLIPVGTKVILSPVAEECFIIPL